MEYGHSLVVHMAVLGYQLNLMALEIFSNLNNSVILQYFTDFVQNSVLSFNYNPARPILVGPFGSAETQSPSVITTYFSCTQRKQSTVAQPHFQHHEEVRQIVQPHPCALN